jgi:hypothetical protein
MSRQLNAAWLILIMKIGLRPDARLTPAGRPPDARLTQWNPAFTALNPPAAPGSVIGGQNTPYQGFSDPRSRAP